MSDMFEMPDFHSEREDREDGELGELVAEYRAMPLREITALSQDGRVASLECGHRKLLRVWLQVGGCVHCRDCYEIGMKKAEHIVEGIRQIHG